MLVPRGETIAIEIQGRHSLPSFTAAKIVALAQRQRDALKSDQVRVVLFWRTIVKNHNGKWTRLIDACLKIDMYRATCPIQRQLRLPNTLAQHARFLEALQSDATRILDKAATGLFFPHSRPPLYPKYTGSRPRLLAFHNVGLYGSPANPKSTTSLNNPREWPITHRGSSRNNAEAGGCRRIRGRG